MSDSPREEITLFCAFQLITASFLAADDEPHNEAALLAAWKQTSLMLATGFMADLVPFPNPVHLVSLALACYYFCLVIRYKLAVFRKARESPEALHNPPFDRRMVLAQIVTITTWCSFPALWFVYYFGFLSMSQIDLYPYLDVSSKLVTSVLFCNVDIGKIDNSKQLKAAVQDSLLKNNLMEVANLKTFENSQKALNHAAKRGLSNVFMEMQAMEKDHGEGLSAEQLKLLTERVMATCHTSMEICQSVELQRRILLNEYAPKLEAVDVQALLEDKLGYKSNPNVQLEFDVPAGLLNCCVEVLVPSVINCMQNAQDHGAKGTAVRIHVSLRALPNTQPELRVEVRNGAGANHQSMLELQRERGRNFLLTGNTYLDNTVRESGSAFSSFLGADEIFTYTQAAGGSAEIEFLEDVVRAELSFPATVCTAKPTALRKPSEGLVLIMADDDAIQRIAAKALIRKGKFHSDSAIFGSTYEEVDGIPARLKDLARVHGDKQIVCIFDQNMDWNSGTQEMYGLSLIKRIVASGFNGLLCMRSGQNDPTSTACYLAQGADIVFGKSGKHLKPDVVLDEIANAQDEKRHKRRD